MTTTATKPDAYAVRRAVQPIVAEYLVAKAHAQLMREVVDARERPLLEAAQIVDDNGAAILTSQRLYRAAEGQEAKAEAFYEAAKAANVGAGWKGDRDHCPALVADCEMTRLENRLIDAGFAAMGQTFTHLSVWGEKRERAISLFCGLALAKK